MVVGNDVWGVPSIKGSLKNESGMNALLFPVESSTMKVQHEIHSFQSHSLPLRYSFDLPNTGVNVNDRFGFLLNVWYAQKFWSATIVPSLYVHFLAAELQVICELPKNQFPLFFLAAFGGWFSICSLGGILNDVLEVLLRQNEEEVQL